MDCNELEKESHNLANSGETVMVDARSAARKTMVDEIWRFKAAKPRMCTNDGSGFLTKKQKQQLARGLTSNEEASKKTGKGCNIVMFIVVSYDILSRGKSQDPRDPNGLTVFQDDHVKAALAQL